MYHAKYRPGNLEQKQEREKKRSKIEQIKQQETATKSHEPKKFLDKTRKALVDNSFENCVGQNAVQIGEIGGVLRVGDVIRVLARKQQGLQLKV